MQAMIMALLEVGIQNIGLRLDMRLDIPYHQKYPLLVPRPVAGISQPPLFSYLDSLLLSLRVPLFTDNEFGRLMPTESDTKVKNQAPPQHLHGSDQYNGKELGRAEFSELTPVIGLTGILSLITIDHHNFW